MEADVSNGREDRMALIYRDSDGVELRLVQPWGAHTGLIPPPSIVFWESNVGHDRQFFYSGDDPTYREWTP